MKKTRRFTELDGLRGIAALAVAICHLTGDYDGRYPDAPDALFHFPWGAYGVQLFFMISGFVILMSATRAKQPSDFVISRVSRLYPPYWIALTLSIVLILAFRIPGTGLYDWKTGLLNYLMFQRWFDIPNVDMVYWTLAIEMQFYVLIFSLLLISRSKLTTKIVTVVATIWLVAAVAVAVWAFPTTHGLIPQAVPTLHKVILNLTLAEHGPLFITGMFCYISRRDGRLHWLVPVAALAAIVNAGAIQTLTHGLIVAGVIAFFLLVAFRESTPALNTRPVQFLGKISYSLYIVHVMVSAAVITLCIPIVGRDLSTLIGLAASIAVAYGVYRIGEQKLANRMRAGLLRLRDGRHDAVANSPKVSPGS